MQETNWPDQFDRSVVKTRKLRRRKNRKAQKGTAAVCPWISASKSGAICWQGDLERNVDNASSWKRDVRFVL